MDERIKEEIEALEAILMDDLEVINKENGHPELVRIKVFPSTADDVKQQYVCLTLEVEFTPGYPDNAPEVRLKNPRGLDDSLLNDISLAIRQKCVEYEGSPVVFELVEIIRERLTDSNLPSCQCVICLYGFHNGDHFTKTQCYHYFHSYCLASHVINTERHFMEEQDKLPAWQKQTTRFQPLCPVCREPFLCDIDSLKSAPPPLDVENARQFEVTAELRTLQQAMASLYIYQKNRGGIIDVDAEKTKLLLVTDLPNEENVEENNESPGPSLQNGITQQPYQSNPNSRHRNNHSKNSKHKGKRNRPNAVTR